jgi:hypothetical protein
MHTRRRLLGGGSRFVHADTNISMARLPKICYARASTNEAVS